MQNKAIKNEFVLLSVPTELMTQAEISNTKTLQMYVNGKKLIIENADDALNYVCDGDCSNCPIDCEDCDFDCENCPCSEICDESEA